MKALIIFSHPNPQSFNGAILEAVKEELSRQNAEVKVKDLYAMNFNPILSASDLQQLHSGVVPGDIAQEQADVTWADTLILISPVWWWSVTAMLKGYIDRVMSYGFAYSFTEKGMQGLLTGKKALVITTSGADEKSSNASGMVEAIRKSFVDAVFLSCGFSDIKYRNCYAVTTVSDQQRRQMLEGVREFVRNG